MILLAIETSVFRDHKHSNDDERTRFACNICRRLRIMQLDRRNDDNKLDKIRGMRTNAYDSYENGTNCVCEVHASCDPQHMHLEHCTNASQQMSFEFFFRCLDR